MFVKMLIDKFLIITFFFLFIGGQSFSQVDPFNNYKPLKSVGKLPEDFTKLSSEVYAENIESIGKEVRNSEKKAQKEFFLKSSFKIHDFLFSGKVLFNDPVSKYLNEVAQEVLKGFPNFNKKIRIYLLNVNQVNAYATNDGIIFFTTGLLSQLENEAQLAFILCHEIAHVTEGHQLQSHLENDRVITGKGEYRKLHLKERMFAIYHHSRENEEAADMKGLDIFKKSKYSYSSLPNVFDIIKYAYLPFDFKKFETSFFEDEYLKFPESYSLAMEDYNKIGEVVSIDEDDEEESTHPAPTERKKALKRKISSRSNENRHENLLGVDKFKKIRNLARFEVVNNYLIEHKYVEAIYNSYVLIDDFKESFFLQKAIGRSLSMLAAMSEGGVFNDKYGYSTKDALKESDWQALTHFINKLETIELKTLAVKYLYGLKKSYDGFDLDVSELYENAMERLVNADEVGSSYFRDKPKGSDTLGIKREEIDITSLSKIDKIKMKRAENKDVDADEYAFIQYALVNELQDEEFKEAFTDYITDGEETEEEVQLSYKEKKKIKHKEVLRGKSLGIKKVILFSPIFEHYDSREGKEVIDLETENKEINLLEIVSTNAALLGVKTVLLNDLGLSVNDIQKHNDYALFMNNLYERDLFFKNEIDVPALGLQELNNVIERYGTPYLMFISVNLFTPNNKSRYLTSVLDLKNGEFTVINDHRINSNCNTRVLNGIVYDTFYQLSKAK